MPGSMGLAVKGSVAAEQLSHEKEMMRELCNDESPHLSEQFSPKKAKRVGEEGTQSWRWILQCERGK